MIRVMIAAPASNSGKTVVTCALLRALRARGLDPCAFKCGPALAWPPLIHPSRFSPRVTDSRKPSMTVTNFLIPSLYLYASLYLMFIYLMD